MTQSKVKMDSVRFKSWINQCYEVIREKSDGPQCLLMENCGGDELDVAISGVSSFEIYCQASTDRSRYNHDIKN